MVGLSCQREDNEMCDNAPVFSSSVRSRDVHTDALEIGVVSIHNHKIKTQKGYTLSGMFLLQLLPLQKANQT